MLAQGIRLADRYAVRDRISYGGETVSRAYDMKTERFVLVRTVSNVSGSEQLLRVRALSTVEGSHLQAVLDAAVYDGVLYAICDDAKGASLSSAFLMHGQYGEKEVLRWARGTAKALSTLHGRRYPIAHGRVDMAHILIDPEKSSARLVNYDIREAVRLQDASRAEEASWLKSRKFYQRRRETFVSQANADAFARDIRAFGEVMYELLTGKKPASPHEPLAECLPEMSEPFANVIENCLADDAARYRSGLELMDALRHLYREDSQYKRYRFESHKRMMAGLACIAAGAILVGAGFFVRSYGKYERYTKLVESVRAAEGSNEPEKNMALIEEAKELLPGKLYAYVLEMQNLYEQGEYQAVVECGKAVKRNRQIEASAENADLRSEMFFTWGEAEFELGDYKEADKAFSDAVYYMPEDNENLLARALRDEAVSLIRDGRQEEAEPLLDKLTKLLAGQSVLSYVNAETAYMEGEYEKAMSLYGEAAEVGEPDMTRRSVLMISKLYGISGETEKRISFLTEQAESANGRFYLTLISELADVWTERAEAEKNVTKKASYLKNAYEQYMTLKKEGSASAHTLDRLAYISETLGDYSAAADFISELTKNYPDDYRGFKRKAFLEAAIEEERQESERTYDEFRDAYNRANALFSSSGNLADDEMLKLRELHEKLRKGGWFG